MDDPAYIDPYAPEFAPEPFGLVNTGAICYLNSCLQLLAGCTAFTRAVLRHAAYMSQTRTGAAMLAFVSAYATAAGAVAAPNTAELSARLHEALSADLAERRPGTRFGGGQECSSEALVQLLEMMEPADTGPMPRPRVSAESPITRLFMHRFRCDLLCRKCRRAVSSETDHMIVFSLFHIDRIRRQPDSPETFAAALKTQVSLTEDYKCPHCKSIGSAFRVYQLIMVPDIIVCQFNLFEAYGGARRARYFPDTFGLPAVGGGSLTFRIVGQVEHSGTMSGGHYWARGLRAGGQVYLLNDLATSAAQFGPSAGTHLVAYNYADCRESAK